MMDTALHFSRVGDEHFDRFASRLGVGRRDRLTLEHRLDPDRFQRIRLAAAMYLSACLEVPRPITSEPELLARLLDARGALVNQAPTGQVVPKRDHALSFGLLHQAVAESLAELDLSDTIDTIDLPFSVRMVYGEADPSRPMRPYASTKPHSDVWAGVPPDAMVVVVPIFGDIEHITIEFGELARDAELRWMTKLVDFADGAEVSLAVPYHDVGIKLGHLYVADARAMHRTVRRRSGGVRVSIDFRFRLKGNEAYRAMVQRDGDTWELERAVPYDRWLAVGRDHLMMFEETMAEARVNRRTMLAGPDYGTDYVLASLGAIRAR